MFGHLYFLVLFFILIFPYLCLVPLGGYLCEESGK